MDTRGRPWLLMAVLAVLSLGATVFVAQRALSDARDVVVRGEADSLLSAVAAGLHEESTAPTSATLEKALAAHQAQGLRYVALVDREGRALAEAGKAEMRSVSIRPGQAIIGDRRVRATGPIGGPPRQHGGGRFEGRPPPMALLVVELEPPVMEQLRAHLMRIAVTAAVAGGVLLAFAVAWSRSAGRLAAIERRAAREQRLVALGSMSSVMAHELRNPLASLKGHAQLLAEDLEGDPKKKAKIDRVVNEAERLEVLTTSLLDFVRDGPIERTSVAPAELVDRALADLAEPAKARVAVDVARAPRDVFVDPQRLARALHNVVDNALQAKADGDVALRMAKEGKDVLVEIRDRGPGIPEDTPIFEPFVTTRTKGTGLGLAVARRIAEQHDGTLTGENHPDGGAVFRLRFPDVRS